MKSLPINKATIDREPQTRAVDTPAADTAAVVTLGADDSECHVITGIEFSYSEMPTGGRLTVVCGGSTTILDVDITSSGPGPLKWPHGLHNAGTKGEAVVVTLAAGGGTSLASLNVSYC